MTKYHVDFNGPRVLLAIGHWYELNSDPPTKIPVLVRLATSFYHHVMCTSHQLK